MIGFIEIHSEDHKKPNGPDHRTNVDIINTFNASRKTSRI